MRRFFLTIGLLALSAFGAKAEVKLEYFQTPSGSIHCQWASGDGLRCDMLASSASLLPPLMDCFSKSRNSFFLAATATPRRLCPSDTIVKPTNPRLKYGLPWTRGRITCVVSDPNLPNLRCSNRDRHGFELYDIGVRFF